MSPAGRRLGRRRRRGTGADDIGQPRGAAAADGYADFRVLLDSPAEAPGMGFKGYAEALAEVIVSGRAEFAIGILGSWGSGKTTLLRAIERNLAGNANVVPVWFDAWRYEKDPNLILPLLDVLREALEKRDKEKEKWAHAAAVEVGRAGLAFLAGLKLSAGLPGGVGAELELDKTIERIKARREQPAPLSFYHEGYRLLGKAIEGLSERSTRRVVIFIDDLDRCLPANALDVLESMKLFFDVEGCVFVVGLDQEIAEKAVALKYRKIAGKGATKPRVSGPEYIKKIFQVPFTLPPVTIGQLAEYLQTIERNSGFGTAQLSDFTDHVRPHFGWLQGRNPNPVNPREIKRLVNLYTIQLKILSRRLDEAVNPSVVLALLCMNFRDDWRPFYEQLAAEPRYFQETLRDALGDGGQPNAVYLAGDRYPLPADLAEYLRGLASAVLRVKDLRAYISAAESTWTADPWLLEARAEVNRLRRDGDELAYGTVPPDETGRKMRGHVHRLDDLVRARRESSGPLGALRDKLDAAVGSLLTVLADPVPGQAPKAGATLADRWAAEALPHVNSIDAALRDWHRYVGP